MSSLDHTPAKSGSPQGVRGVELADPALFVGDGGACPDTTAGIRAQIRTVLRRVVIRSRRVIANLLSTARTNRPGEDAGIIGLANQALHTYSKASVDKPSA
jgi:hypothetical protein